MENFQKYLIFVHLTGFTIKFLVNCVLFCPKSTCINHYIPSLMEINEIIKLIFIIIYHFTIILTFQKLQNQQNILKNCDNLSFYQNFKVLCKFEIGIFFVNLVTLPIWVVRQKVKWQNQWYLADKKCKKEHFEMVMCEIYQFLQVNHINLDKPDLRYLLNKTYKIPLSYDEFVIYCKP